MRISSIFTSRMINNDRKYSALITSIVLTSYLFLSFATIFHFHHLEILNPDSITKHENHQSKLDLNYNGLNCFVIQNYNSLHTTITNDLSSNEIILADIDILVSLNQSNNLPSYSFTRFYLRAPPFSIS